MKGKVLLGFVMLVGMLFLFTPFVHAELVSQPLDDQAPFWHELLVKLGLFSVTGYTGTTEDQYCRSTWECVKTSSGLYRYDCYNSGLSPTSCLCSTTTDSSKCAINPQVSSKITCPIPDCNPLPKITGKDNNGCDIYETYTYDSVNKKCNPTTQTTTSSSCNPPGGVWGTCSGNTLNTWTMAGGCKYTNIDCTRYNGRTCQTIDSTSAKCGDLKSFCTDSDGGVDYSKKGTVSTITGDRTDYCYSSSILTEYACYGDTFGANSLTCPNGCSDGVCKGAQPTVEQKCTLNTQQCSGKVIQKCVSDNIGGTYWLDYSSCGTGTCEVQSSGPGCVGGTAVSNLKPSITDEQIKNINSGTMLKSESDPILAATHCTLPTDCKSGNCIPPKILGFPSFGYGSLYDGYCYDKKITVTACSSPTDCLGGQTCTSGKCVAVATCSKDLDCLNGQLCDPTAKTCIMSATSTTATKSTTYLIAGWLATTPAQRLMSVCKIDKDCANYTDLAGTGKEYGVQCTAAGQVQSQLQTDVDKICNDQGWTKYLGQQGNKLVIVGGAAGAVFGLGGCVAGASTATVSELSLGGAPVYVFNPIVGAAATGTAAIIGCVTGAVAGAAIGTAGTAFITGSVGSALQINCHDSKLPSDAGACIAVPKGGYSFLDQVSQSYTLFGIQLPVIVWIISFFLLIIIVLSAIGGGKK